MSELRTKCRCDHPDTYHEREAGFYDVRPQLGKCDVVGCPCDRYEARTTSRGDQ